MRQSGEKYWFRIHSVTNTSSGIGEMESEELVILDGDTRRAEVYIRTPEERFLGQDCEWMKVTIPLGASGTPEAYVNSTMARGTNRTSYLGNPLNVSSRCEIVSVDPDFFKEPEDVCEIQGFS